jgi:hypothetical protein
MNKPLSKTWDWILSFAIIIGGAFQMTWFIKGLHLIGIIGLCLLGLALVIIIGWEIKNVYGRKEK